jgi:oxygen-independent coproporphyrinogen-3 oxidase
LSIGVQDISPMILKAINRDQSKEEVITVTQQARAIGYTSINYDIIYGLPFQKEEHIKDTIELVKEMRPDRLAFYGYAHVPWKSKGQRAFSSKDLSHGIEKHKLELLGDSMLRSAGYKAIAMDHYALPTDNLYKAYKNGKLFRNFMGFTDTTTQCQIGLGNSAISDSGTMYMQNEKSVEGYQQLVVEYGHALIKGHKRSEMEIIVGRHILDLICNDETTFNNTPIDRDIQQICENRITELKNDGLIEMIKNKLNITSSDKTFVRNTCASLDPYISTTQDENRFSMAI